MRYALALALLLGGCEAGPDYGPCIQSHDEDAITVGADGMVATTTESVCDMWAKGLGNGRVLVTTRRGQSVVTLAEMAPR
jgi:hypothetical protein